MEMIMPANQSNTASQWLDRTETPAWTARLGETIGAILEAMATGRAAQHDHRKLAVHGVAPQAATRAVLRKHFGQGL
jgi:hypothetical protein